MKNETIIITEGEFDKMILEKILEGRTFNSKYEIKAASGYSSALSKVRTLLTSSSKKILLLLDSDTIDDDKVKEKSEFVNYYINGNAINKKFKTVWAIPEFEIIFFENEKFINELAGKRKITNLEIAKSSPRRLLNLLNPDNKNYINILNNKEIIDEFFKEDLVKQIADFIQN